MRNRLEPYEKTGPLFDNSSERDFSFDEDTPTQDNHFHVSELYRHIGAPNPLHESEKKYNWEVKTAYKINYRSLPKYLSNICPPQRNSHTHAKDHKAVRDAKEKLLKTEPVEVLEPKSPEAANNFSKTLFSLYPESDPRLVYRKYSGQGNFQLGRPGFANYLVDIDKIPKTVYTQFKEPEEKKATTRRTGRNDGTLRFDSVFESGNLFSAYKVADDEYDLVLQNDINTRGHTQWFFFSVANTRRNQTVKFNLINLLKGDSLFNEGMQPAVFSTLSYNLGEQGWHRDGFNISYYKNGISKEGVAFCKSYYTLTFTYTFTHSKDVVYFSHCFPYTFSRLNSYLDSLCQDPVKKRYITRKTLCQTMAQNNCEYLTITSRRSILDNDERQAIVLTARQHPGESLSSYMIQGVIDFLTSEEEEAKALRQHYVFKIIPMMNPDGVIHGNYRTNLCGKDLNRKWKNPDKTLQPTVFAAKELIQDISRNRNIRFVCDFHGHSRKKNTFFYGNAPEDDPLPVRVFPFMLSKLSKYVTFEDSRFMVQKAKEETARIALWRELGINDIFTLEASFYGYKHEGKTHHFTEEDYINIGIDFCKGLYLYLIQNNLHVDLTKAKNEPASSLRQDPGFNAARIIEELNSNSHLINMGNRSDDSGSDSNPSGDDLSAAELRKLYPTRLKVLVKKSKKKVKQKHERSNSDLLKKADKKFVEPKVENPEDKLPKKSSFRVKNFRKTMQSKDASASQNLGTIDEAEMTDKFTQTEEMLFTIKEYRMQARNQEFRSLGYQNSSKSPVNRTFTRNLGFLKGMESFSGGGGFSYLDLFSEKSYTSKNKKDQKRDLWIKGAKMENEKSISEQPYILGKNQVTKATSTDFDQKPANYLFMQQWNRTGAFMNIEERHRDKGLFSSHNLLIHEEKKRYYQSFTVPDEDSVSFHNSRQALNDTPQGIGTDASFMNCTVVQQPIINTNSYYADRTPQPTISTNSYYVDRTQQPTINTNSYYQERTQQSTINTSSFYADRSRQPIANSNSFYADRTPPPGQTGQMYSKISKLPSRVLEIQNKSRKNSESLKDKTIFIDSAETIKILDSPQHDRMSKVSSPSSKFSKFAPIDGKEERTSLYFPSVPAQPKYKIHTSPSGKLAEDSILYKAFGRPVTEDPIVVNRSQTMNEKPSGKINTKANNTQEMKPEAKESWKRTISLGNSGSRPQLPKKMDLLTLTATSPTKTIQNSFLKRFEN